MRDFLFGFHAPTESVLKDVWSNCIFVVDANFILNLYRYESHTRKELIDVMRAVRARLWLPNYAAIEFQRNRPKVIAEQKKRFTQVREIIGKIIPQTRGELSHLQLKKRHNSIDPEGLLDQIDISIAEFLLKLSEIERSQIDVHQDTHLRDDIEKIFEGRIGDPPTKEWLSKVVEDGAERYINKIPPGYCDIGKGKEADPHFMHGGLKYERMYGDLIIWHQILEYSRSSPNKKIVFLTDDAKEDWWWIVDSGGNKKLGPRPEFIDEMMRLGKASFFYMYGPERFLQLSKQHLRSEVSEQTLQEVRDVSRQNSLLDNHNIMIKQALSAAKDWLAKSFPGFNLVKPTEKYPDFFVTFADETKNFCLEYIPVSATTAGWSIIRVAIPKIVEGFRRSGYPHCYVLVASHESRESILAAETQIRLDVGQVLSGIRIIFGNIEEDAEAIENFSFREIFSIEN